MQKVPKSLEEYLNFLFSLGYEVSSKLYINEKTNHKCVKLRLMDKGIINQFCHLPQSLRDLSKLNKEIYREFEVDTELEYSNYDTISQLALTKLALNNKSFRNYLNLILENQFSIYKTMLDRPQASATATEYMLFDIYKFLVPENEILNTATRKIKPVIVLCMAEEGQIGLDYNKLIKLTLTPLYAMSDEKLSEKLNAVKESSEKDFDKAIKIYQSRRQDSSGDPD